MTKNKITLIQPADFSSGSQWLELVPANQGTRQDHLDRTPLHGRATHIHSDWDSVDTPIHLTHTALGCGRKQWYPENTTQTWEEVPTPQGQ